MFKFPWTRRADRDREARIEAEKKLRSVKQEWEHLVKPAVERIEREDRLNHWTENLQKIYIGGGR